MIMDETGKVVSRINMDDWGNVNKYRVGARAEINYTGKKLDTATGLYYFNQRYYDPEIGRFSACGQGRIWLCQFDRVSSGRSNGETNSK